MGKRWYFLSLLIIPLLSADKACCIDACTCCDGPPSGYFNFRQREPGGIGYPRGYTSADLFYTLNFSERWNGFIDLRGHIFNNAKWATNAGIGLRFVPDCDDAVYGANFYWDWRETKHTNFHQLGGGLEVLWPCWDIHFNGYAPVNSHKKFVNQRFEKFQGHTAFFSQKHEVAMWGLDLNVGSYLLKYDCFTMHAGLGGYYFYGDFREKAAGGLFRLKLRFWDWIFAEGQVSYDNQFKWQGQGELGFHVPFGPKVTRYSKPTHSCCDLIAIEERLVEQPERFEIVVTTSHRRTGKGRNPTTGELVNFFFVNNLSGSDGSFESPFATLQEALLAADVGDAIYLFPGDGGAYILNILVPLQDYQLVGSSGAPFEMDTRFGRIDIPAQTADRARLGGDLALANRNYISGLEMETLGFALGLAVKEAPVIRDNIIVSEQESILLFAATGEAIIERNFLQSNSNVVISLTNLNGSIRLTGNRIVAIGVGAAEDAAIYSGNDFNGQFLIEDSIISSNGKGIHFDGPQAFKGTFEIINTQIFSVGKEIEFGP